MASSSSLSAWAAQWQAAVDDIRDEPTYMAAADRLRKLVKAKLLLFSDIENNPDKVRLAAWRVLEYTPCELVVSPAILLFDHQHRHVEWQDMDDAHFF